ncbi:MAG: hypothetical protein IJ518_08060 [Clostridia bacterium]|nr:hypothetical protein [Clostridia bacterium]
MANNRPNRDKAERAPREFFTLGEHMLGNRSWRFRYDGRIYHILEKRDGQEEETLLLEEPDSRKAYDAWNRIKRPERFGGMA